jgi:vacuolar-type H+-ATPase subunit F/Vma7
MSRVVAIGAAPTLLGFELVGVDVVDAAEPEQVRAAWDEAARTADLVVLTVNAREALPARLAATGPLWVTLPE